MVQADDGAGFVSFVRAEAAERDGVLDFGCLQRSGDRVGDAILERAEIATGGVRRNHHVNALGAGEGFFEREAVGEIADARLGALSHEALQAIGAASDHSNLRSCIEQAFRDDVARVAARSGDDVHDVLLLGWEPCLRIGCRRR